MTDETQGTTTPAHYKQVLPAGLAPEVTAGSGATVATTAAFGRWLRGQLTADGSREQVAGLSGMEPWDFSQMLDGHSQFSLDADHVQRIATALLELGLVTNPALVWEAAGYDQTDYIVPPAQVVQSMSGNV